MAHARQVAALFDLVADGYDQHVPFFSAFAERFVPWVGIEPGELVLDVGAGRGALSRVAEARGAVAVPVDLAAEMLRHCAGRRARMDASDLAIRSESIDVVVAAFSLHLLPDPDAGIVEAVRALRRGGRLAIAVPGPPPPDGSAGAVVASIMATFLEDDALPSLLPPLVPFDPVESVRRAGLAAIETTEEWVRLPVIDAETYLRGERSHGYRAAFEAVHPSRRAAFDAEIHEALEHLASRGELLVERSARFVAGAKS